MDYLEVICQGGRTEDDVCDGMPEKVDGSKCSNFINIYSSEPCHVNVLALLSSI